MTTERYSNCVIVEGVVSLGLLYSNRYYLGPQNERIRTNRAMKLKGRIVGNCHWFFLCKKIDNVQIDFRSLCLFEVSRPCIVTEQNAKLWILVEPIKTTNSTCS
jgi:hypothetical protein